MSGLALRFEAKTVGLTSLFTSIHTLFIKPSPSNRDEDIEEGNHEGSLGASEQVSNNGWSYCAVTGLSSTNQGSHEDQHPEILQDIMDRLV